MASSLKPRRLFELLEQQQEPFLLRNGYSRRSFESKYAFRCWKLNSRALRRSCILSGLHTKLVYWPFIKRALNWERLKLGDCFSEMRRETKTAYFHRLSSSCVELSGDNGLEEIEHSPVSVLALHYDEGFSDRNHSMVEENGSTSRISSPTMSMPPQLESKRELYQQGQLLLNYTKEMVEQCCEPCEFWGQKLSGNIMGKDIFPLEKQREDLPIFTQLLGLDLSATQREWTQFQTERREIEKAIGGLIFEEIREECVFDMLLGFHCTYGT